jgi:LysR family transcriptional activator of glutamate synthase operon
MDITLTALKYFKKIAELQHMTKAAAELHVAQSSLSYMLKSLEEELDVPLFDRLGRNITLTPYGEALLEGVNKILQDVDGIKESFDAINKEKMSSVKLTFLTLSSLAPFLLTGFKKVKPDAKLSFQFPGRYEAGDLKKYLKESDFVLVSTEKPLEEGCAITLFQEEMVIALPVDDPHASHSVVQLRDFEKYPFLKIQSEPSLNYMVMELCSKAGFVPSFAMESDNMDVIREFVRTGIGILLLPNITWGKIAMDKGIAAVPITEPSCRRYISLVWDRGKKLSPLAMSLKSYMEEHIVDSIKKSTWSAWN